MVEIAYRGRGHYSTGGISPEEKFVFAKRIENYIAAAQTLFIRKKATTLADVLENGNCHLDLETGFDNWDGGQYSHSLLITVPLDVFEEVSTKLVDSEEAIKAEINAVSNEVRNESLESVSIVPELEQTKTDKEVKIRKGAKIKTAFDEYVLVKQIGEGGNGRVFSAENLDGETVAIKILGREAVRSRKRFKNEITYCQHCQHRNIVKITDYGCIEAGSSVLPFYVMPLYEESLREKIKRGLSPVEALQIFSELLSALQTAHADGVIHRDVKPENILFSKGSLHPILCDFGIAHIPRGLAATTVVTASTERMANFRYAAPEQKSGRNEDVVPQTDIYALGLVLNEMFTKDVPNAEGYTKIGDIAPDYAFLDDVFSMLFQQDPEKRLYPEDKIFSEIRTRSEISRNDRLRRELSSANIGASPMETPVMSVVRKGYKDSNVFLEFAEKIPDRWLSILVNGAYSHRSLMGYDTNVVRRLDPMTLAIPFCARDDAGLVTQIISDFSDWVLTTNALYRDELIAENRQRQRAAVADRKREIARLERETRIQQIIA